MEFTEENEKRLAAQLRQPHGDDGIKVGEMMNQGNLNINRHTFNAVEVKANDRLLEVGPGNGFFAKDLLAKADDVTYVGCDFSELMVEQAQALNAALVAQGRATFVHAECDNMPFDDGSFDKILTVNTIYFWPNPDAALAEFSRVLAPSGMLIIGLRPEHNMKLMPFTKHGFEFWTRQRLEALFAESPFTLKEIQHNVEETSGFGGIQMVMENYVVVAVKKVKQATILY